MNPEVPTEAQVTPEDAVNAVVSPEQQAAVQNFPAEAEARSQELLGQRPAEAVAYRQMPDGQIVTEAEFQNLVNNPDVERPELRAGTR